MATRRSNGSPTILPKPPLSGAGAGSTRPAHRRSARLRPRARRAHGPHPGRFRAADRARHDSLEPSRVHGLFRQFVAARGILGELLAAALNGNGMLWKTSPAVTELEQVVLGWLRQWTGLPADWFGMIHDTASTGAMHALAAARQAADPDVRTRGGRSPDWWSTPPSRPTPRIEKGAIALGMGQENVRHVPVDGEFRMRVDALDGHDRARPRRRLAPLRGRRPRWEPLPPPPSTPCRPSPTSAERHGIWLHVDAAYAGSAAVARGIPLAARRLRARRFAHHQPAQVAAHARWIAACFTPAARRC